MTVTGPATDVSTIPATVARLRAAFDSGRTTPLEWRRAQLHRLRTLVTEHERELLDALAADVGKPPIEAYAADLGFVTGDVDLALKHLDRWTRPRRVRTPMTSQPAKSSIVREPLGVVLVIAPWNYPIQLQLAPMVAAIAAGNAVVAKPSEVSPRCSALLGRLIPEYLDPEAIAVVEGGVTETTALLDERFDHIFYTGNGRVARVVMAAAARNLTPVTLELGGKSPTIVARDAKIELAARRIAWGKFLNAGQTCIAPDYVLVDRAVEEPLLDALASTVRKFYGADPRHSPDYARIVNDTHFRRLEKLLHDGRTVVGGETYEAARYIAPTILADVSPDAPVMDEEIFGPILPVIAVDGVGEAISFVRERDKPLALYVFTESDEIADLAVAETSSGGVCVNATLLHIANTELPFGGVGESGMGAYHGESGFETFSHHKSVMRRSTRLDPPVMYPPYRRWKERVLRRVL
ncbi:MAG: aldehyde dehydrogenase family protein [Acidimicrobiia bacterium]|nr:aldehyde dehydrogenase family protein [Acidimicrobiia bacterium]